MGTAAEKKLSSSDMCAMLAERFPDEAYALFFEVRNGTGFDRRTTRTADALAMSLWPSRGLEIHGFEVKVNRGDWLSELKTPAKAHDIGRFCHRWWLVAAPGVLAPGELPPKWGLLIPRGGKLFAQVDAPRRDAEALDSLMLASLLRQAQRANLSSAMVQKHIADKVRDGIRNEQSSKAHSEHRLAELQKAVADFEQASGVSLSNRWECGKIGEAVRTIMYGGNGPIDALKNLRRAAETEAKHLGDCIAQLEKARP